MKMHDLAIEQALRDATAFKTAAEAVAGTLAAPAFQSMIEEHHRLASGMIASIVQQSDVRTMTEQAVLNATAGISKQVSAVCGLLQAETEANIRGLVGGSIAGSAFAAASENLSRHREQIAEMRQQFRPPYDSRSLPRIRRPIVPPPIASGAIDFMQRLLKHIEEAKEEVEKSGGVLIVNCKTPSGEDISVRQVSSVDEHFVRVKGVDQFGHLHDFKGHHSGIAISIEVVTRSDDSEDEDENEIAN